jgi:hypothetical protein
MEILFIDTQKLIYKDTMYLCLLAPSRHIYLNYEENHQLSSVWCGNWSDCSLDGDRHPKIINQLRILFCEQ